MTNALVVVPGQSRSDEFYKKFFHKIFSIFSFSSDTADYSSTSSEPSYKSARAKKHFKKNFFFYIPIALVVLVLGFMLIRLLTADNSGTSAVAGITDKRVSLKKPIAAQTINKTFSFPLKDAAGKELSQLKMVVTDVELQDEIVIKGQKAKAIEGKVFLIVNLKLTNDYSKTIQINTRDYIRLSVNNSEERLAAEVHNDPVEVQAISTKYTRVGFPVSENDKNLTLFIGEINGDKQQIKLNLQK